MVVFYRLPSARRQIDKSFHIVPQRLEAVRPVGLLDHGRLAYILIPFAMYQSRREHSEAPRAAPSLLSLLYGDFAVLPQARAARSQAFFQALVLSKHQAQTRSIDGIELVVGVFAAVVVNVMAAVAEAATAHGPVLIEF
ncbi:hypothetical protein CCR75_002181 [Bremia lactucae]|uniref:Uncharacterized protein n=1 Tax=Bremia lactucae TaxID=4779 RepID=A0A976FT20_BRELC|nr:hypothetical protein CCR75_002181 [Bremia lactucae]